MDHLGTASSNQERFFPFGLQSLSRPYRLTQYQQARKQSS
jgi:hypothetical protein